MRRAYTLMELLLVLAILIAVAAAAAPALTGVIQDQRLKSGADEVRIAFTRAHIKAMKTGRIQVFRCELGGSQFSVQPWAAADDAIEAAPQVLGFGAAEEEVASPRLDESAAVELPEGVTFLSSAASLEARAQSIERDIKDASRFEASWSQPILFYPDGSTSDAYVVVANEREVGIRVELRGMTGTASLGEITAVEELSEETEVGGL
jgi:type II secretory pathway pseudopilin PulG